MAKLALGKGLGALINTRVASPMPAVESGERVQRIRLEQIVPTPLQPRTVFRDEHLEELVASIREQGIIQPLIARQRGDKYELIAGERRWRAAQRVGLAEAPVIIREASDQDVLELALIENLQREDLNAIEEARGYRRLIDEFKLTAKPMATGNPAATLTAVMTDQVDVGWASPPFGLKEQEEGNIHVVAKATDAALVRDQTIRVIVANAQVLAKRKDVIDRFMQAYRETIDYMYSDNPQVIKDYAEFVKVPEPMAKRVRDEFFPKSLIDPDEIKGVDALVKEAVTLKFIPAPLTQQQLTELIQIPPRKK
jgi:ParB/RepB/Spo0J family partition protein